MLRVGVEVDARDQPLLAAGDRGAAFMPLIEEVRPVVIGVVRPRLPPLELEVGVLVGLGLLRLGRVRRRRQHLRELGIVGARHVVLVAVERDDARGVLQPGRPLRPRDLLELRGQSRGRRVARRPFIGGRDVRQAGASRRIGPSERGESDAADRRRGDGASPSTRRLRVLENTTSTSGDRAPSGRRSGLADARQPGGTACNRPVTPRRHRCRARFSATSAAGSRRRQGARRWRRRGV
jgi:hypothetical protein